MKNFKVIILLAIFLIVVFFRLYKFNQIPVSLDWDEVAIGWNAASIWEAKIDQYGKRWPISFQSFGDYKAPFLIYATAPFVGIFGAKDWAIRLPSLICGLLSAPLLYLITIQISQMTQLKQKPSPIFTLLSVLLFSVSAWHIRFSRVAFEPNVALFSLLLGIYFLLLSLKNHYFYVLSGFFFIVSLYTYHSPKMFIPVFLLGYFLVFRTNLINQIKKHYFIFILYLVFLGALTIPLVRETFFGKGGQRSDTLIFFENGKLVKLNSDLFIQIFKNFITHLSPRFYLYGQDENFRNNLLNYGLITPIEYLFFIAGIFYLFKNSKQKYSQLLFIWLLAGLLPGVLSRPEHVPHSLRTLNAMPAVLLTISLGFVNFIAAIKDKKISFFENNIKIYFPALSIIIFFFVFSLRAFYIEYFIKFPIYSGSDWQYGYKEIAEIASRYENQVDQIRITSFYGQPYVFTAFYQKRNPLYVIWGEMSKYAFPDKIDWEGDQFIKNTLLIGTGNELPENVSPDAGEFITEIKYPNNEVAFRIIKTR